MADNALITTAVIITRELAGTALKETVANDTNQPLLGRHRSERIVRDFDSFEYSHDIPFDFNDKVFEEFSPVRSLSSAEPNEPNEPNESNEDDLLVTNSQEWKENRPHKGRWFLICLKVSVCLISVSGLLGIAGCVVTIIDMNTANVCIWLDVHQLQKPIQQIRVIATCIEDHATMYFPMIIFTFTFGFKLMHKLKLLYLDGIAAFADTFYRLILHMFDLSDAPWKSFVSNVLLLLVMFINCYVLARYFYHSQRERVLFVLRTGISNLVIVLVPVVTFRALVPWVNGLNIADQFIVTSASPIIGTTCKVLSRLSVQSLDKVVHPGNLYMLSAFPYLGAAIIYRALQANLKNTIYFSVLCFTHGSFGVLRVSTLLIRNKIYAFVFRYILRRDNYESRIGVFLTPKNLRYTADLRILEMIHQHISILYCNAIVQLYPLVFVKNVAKSQYKEIVFDFFLRCGIASLSECVFNVFSIHILTWHLNVPVVKLWRMKWKQYMVVNAFYLAMIIFYCTYYLTKLVDQRFHHTRNNGTAEACNSSTLLFYE